MAVENFAKKVKEEIAKLTYNEEQTKGLLSGFLRNGTIFRFGKIPSIIIKTELSKVARLIYNSFKNTYNLKPKIEYEQKIYFGKGTIYNVVIKDLQIYKILEELEVMNSSFEKIQPNKYLSDDYFEYFLVGTFLSCGSINNPKKTKTSYYLELSLTNNDDAELIHNKLDSFKEEKTMKFKYIKRRNKYVLYLKKSDQISVFLSYIGATSSMFDFENIRILKDEVNINNRLNICDMANFTRTIEASNKDIEKINKLLEIKDISSFSSKEQAVINTRKKYKEANYRELTSYIENEYGIKISKSTLARILTSIREECNRLNIV